MTNPLTQLQIAAQWLEEASVVLSLMGKDERALSRTLKRVSEECKSVVAKENG